MDKTKQLKDGRGRNNSPAIMAISPAQEKAIRAWLENTSSEQAELVLWSPLEPEPQDNTWSHLGEGDRIRAITNGRIITGIVDCIADDGSIFWVWQDSGQGRTMIHEGDSATVFVDEC
ncbi:hypothetical protein [Paenarthrobacter sp. NPDC018779]|uniref:hypothetical protein n=1 Tax=Paenarthrobacter sp. NPDC018779 TaxID=3364375 RepID=UPI0037CB79E5